MRSPRAFVLKSGKVVPASALAPYRVDKQHSRALGSDFPKTSYASGGLVPPLHAPKAMLRLLDISTWHRRACKTKARDTGGLGWTLQAANDEDADSEGATASKSRLEDFFQQLEEDLPTTLERMQMDVETFGYGALEIPRLGNVPDGEPVNIVHVQARGLRIHKDGNRICQRRGRKKVWFRIAGKTGPDGRPICVDYDSGAVGDESEIPVERRATDMIWWTNYTPRSDLYGESDIVPAVGALVGDAARAEYNVSFFSNHGIPAWAVFVTGNFEDKPILDNEGNETGETDLSRAIEDHLDALKDEPHSTLLLTIPSAEAEHGAAGGSANEVKVDFQRLATEVKDASFRLYRKDNRDEQLAAHGVEPYRIGIAESGALGQNVAEATTEIYKRSVIEPRQTQIEHRFNRHVIRGVRPGGGFGIHDWIFKLAEIDTEDEAHRMELYAQLAAVAAVWPDEIRKAFADRLGLDPNRLAPAEDAPDIPALAAKVRAMEAFVEYFASAEAA